MSARFLLLFLLGKQADWGKSWETRKIPQLEANQKQGDLGESWKIRKIPQLEANQKQGDWGEKVKNSENSPTCTKFS